MSTLKKSEGATPCPPPSPAPICGTSANAATLSDLLRPLRIGAVTLPNNLVLSPMAGFSDLPFRVLCRRHGAGLVCSEMVAAKGVLQAYPDTMLRMRTLEEERPMSIQLFGTDPAEVARAAQDVDRCCAILGLNMGCPAHQIQRQGCGAAMLDSPERALAVVEAIKGASDKPLLVKMRLGNRVRMDEVAFARSLERAGADGLIVHGRTAAQGYSGRSDWDAISRVKQALSIPVIGNGDVIDGASARRALETGVDGIALGRAALGDPRIFERIAFHLESGERAPPADARERVHDFRAYLEMAQAIGLDAVQVREQAQQFTRGLRGGGALRRAFTGAIPLEDVLARFEAFAQNAPAGAAPEPSPAR